jgi:predicted ATPase
MITLKKVTVHKYKSYLDDQSFEVADKITVLVGKNESGKTAALEALAKTNYFTDDDSFKFNTVHDYPRMEKKKFDKSGDEGEAITCEFEISDELLDQIEADLGKDVFTARVFSECSKYKGNDTIGGISADLSKFLEHKAKEFELAAPEAEKLNSINSLERHRELLQEEIVKREEEQAAEVAKAQKEGTPQKTIGKSSFEECLENITGYLKEATSWENPLAYYVYSEWIMPNQPKYLYYDEYFALPARIDIAQLNSSSLNESELKTAQALFEIAEIDVSKLLSSSTTSSEFEEFTSELEATSNLITNEIFKYWSTNTDLKIRFAVDQNITGGKPRPILDIRVENPKHGVTLSLKNRSKGFNWFFSFIVWFSKIQEDKDSNYILLLDEPGLNLHASAQADLLRFIENLSEDYQIIYTTHSPFMVEPENLDRVQTVVENDHGTSILDSIQEKDPDTLFPLQAALGYDIAQNLFISPRNLLVEGPADLLYLTTLSALLEAEGRQGLRDDITIVPVGGLDKVVTFISLLRATKLGIACLLDTLTNAKGKQRLDDMVKQKLIKSSQLCCFDEFTAGNSADVEDLFEREDYLKIFNAAFSDYSDIKVDDLDSKSPRMIPQITAKLKLDRYNHYIPAKYLTQQSPDADFFSKASLDRFESVFKKVNTLFKK